MTENTNFKYAYFGGGCFWCIEAAFADLDGVEDVISGYSGGTQETANYQSVSTGKTKHAEICKIQYNPTLISYETLLEVFFLSHNPTTLNRQGNDIGPQYRSIILYQNSSEKELINNHITQLKKDSVYTNIVTEITPFNNFYVAEKYHQNYFKLNPNQPYCNLIIKPKIQHLRKKLKKYYKD